MFKGNYCTAVEDWLQVYNVVDLVSFIVPFSTTAEQYYPNKIDVCKDAISIQGISMKYVLHKSLKEDKKLESYKVGGIYHVCWDKQVELQKCSCNGTLKCGGYREGCQFCKNVSVKRLWESVESLSVYDLLKPGIMCLSAQVFITHIRSHVYKKESILAMKTIGYNANSLNLY